MKNGTLNSKTRLSDLLIPDLTGASLIGGDPNVQISSVEYNSMKVSRGSMFVAVEGFTSDGHNFVRDAVERGAAAILVSRSRADEFTGSGFPGIAVLASDNTRFSLSGVSSLFYGRPSSRVPVIGITGTNGKTSITYMLESIFRKNGCSPGVMGTVNYRWKGNEITASNTTPESRDIHEIMSRMVDSGVDIIIMEVSSHGLELNRADHIEFDAGVFTNLTRDHLDFHRDFSDYFSAKRRLFSILDKSGKITKSGIINIDDEYGMALFEDRSRYSYSFSGFGVENETDYFPQKNSIVNRIEGISYILEKPEGAGKIGLKLSGRFNVYNSLCALAAAHRMGVSLDIIRQGLSEIERIPGRLERINSGLGFYVVVDYAHTNDALLKLLLSVREITRGKLITIMGCGGNRDRSKRPLMGEAAVVNSDWVIVTSDNPRMEDPLDIINDIITGINKDNYEVIPDRREAIKRGVELAGNDDVVVIAGKGHEDYQILGEKKIHFDDCELAREFIQLRKDI